MKAKTYFIFVAFVSFCMVSMACGQKTTEKEPLKNESIEEITTPSEPDSITIRAAFEKLKTDKAFLKDLGLDNEEQFSWNNDFVKITYGDLNGDGVEDAVFPFAIEGRGGGNNSDFHYAIFLKENNQWKYLNQFNAQAGSPDLFYGFEKIENGTIYGIIGGDKTDEEIPVEFILKNNELINTFTALHKTEISEREYISVSEILTPNNISIPLSGTLNVYQKLLGKGKMAEFENQPDCGTQFDEGLYSELQYPHLIFEVNNHKDAVFIMLMFKNSGFKLQTDKGTITGKTTLKELQNILQQNDSWWINDEKDGGKSISIPDSEDADNGWIIRFDKSGKIESIRLFIPC